MRSRRTLTVVAVCLVIVLLGAIGFVAWRYANIDTVREVVVQRLEALTGRDVEVQGDFDLVLSLTPTFAAERVVVANALWGSRPAMLTADRIEVTLQAVPLLWDGDVLIDRLVVNGGDLLLETGPEGQANWQFGEAEEPEPTEPAPAFLLDEVSIQDSRLAWHDVQTGRTETALVARFTWQAEDVTSALTVDGAGRYRSRPVTLSGQLGSIADLLAAEDPYPLALQATLGDMAAQVEGQVSPDFPAGETRLEVELAGEALANLGELVETELPPLGPYRVETVVASDGEGALVAADPLQATIGSAERVLLQAEGRIGDLLAGEGIQLDAAAEGAEVAALGELLDTELPALGPYAVQGTLTGSAESLALTDLTGRLGQGGALQVRVIGGRIAQLLEGQGIELPLEAEGPEVAALGELLDLELPPLGPYALAGELSGSLDSLALTNLTGRLGEEDTLQVRLTGGRIGQLLEGDDIQLALEAEGPEVAALSDLVGMELPPLGPYALGGTLAGSLDSLALADLTGWLGQEGALQVRVAPGRIDQLLEGEGIELWLEAEGPEVAALGELVDTELPELGPYAFEGRVAGSTDALALTGLTGTVGEGDVVLVRLTDGAIANVLAGGGVRVPLRVESTALAVLAELAGIEIAPFGSVTLEGTLVGSIDNLGVTDLVATAGDEAARLTVAGAIANLLEATGLDLALDVEGTSLAALSPLVGVELPPSNPYRLAADVNGSVEDLQIERLQATLADSTLTGWLSVRLPAEEPPQIEGELTADRLDLDRALALAEAAAPEQGEEGGTPAAAKEPQSAAAGGDGLFPDEPLPLEALDELEMNLVLRADQLLLDQTEFENASATVLLEEGRLSVRDLTLRVAGGAVAGDLAVDTTAADGATDESAAEVTVSLSANNIDAARLLTDFGAATSSVTGEIDLDINVDSTGRSLDQLMDELEGSAAVVAEEGQVEDVPLDLLAPDLDILNILPPFWRRDSAVRINCLIGEFDIDEGIARTEAMMDTRRMTLLGQGTVNLAAEELELALRPVPKGQKLSRAAVPVDIEGPLTEPEVRPRVGEAAGQAIRGVLGGLLIPFNQIAALFGRETADACADALEQARQRRAAAAAGGAPAAPQPTAAQ